MKKKYLSIAVIAALASFEACAQESVVKLDEILVTTSSMNQVSLKNTPATMSVITAEDIKTRGITTVKDALKRVPGLNIQTGSGSGVIGIRGSTVNEVLYLLNGRKIASVEDTFGRHQRAEWITENIDVNSIERIEILRGSASALYGSDGAAGVINIITKKAQEKQYTAGVQLGNYKISNYYNLDFGRLGNWDTIVNVNLTKNLAKRKTFERVDGAYYNSPEGENINVMLDTGYQLDENNELRFFGNINYEDVISETNGSGGKGLELEQSREDEVRYNAVVEYNGSSESNNYKVSLGYDHFAVDAYDSEAPYAFDESYYTGIINLDARNTYSMNNYNTITFGGAYKYTKMTASWTESVWKLRGLNYVDEYAFFIQDEITLLNEKLYIVPALRYDRYSTFGGQTSPNIGATYHISNNHRIKTSYGEAFQAPETGRLYTPSESNGTGRRGNPDLKPETSKTYELRYEGEYKNLSGAITAYKSDYKNRVQRYLTTVTNEFVTDGRLYLYRNIGKAQNEGFEVELAYDFQNNFTTKASYVKSDFKDLDKNIPFEDSPSAVTNIELSYANPDWNFNSSVYAQYVADIYTTSSGITGRYANPERVSYSTFGLSMRKSWEDKYSFTLSADNIFNNLDSQTEEYLDPTSVSVSFEVKF